MSGIPGLDAQVAQAQVAPARTHAPERDAFAAFTVKSTHVEVEGGHGTVRVGERKSTGVTCLLYLPASGKRMQAIPLNAITDAGFLTEAQYDALLEDDDAPEAEVEDAPEEDAPEVEDTDEEE